MAAPMDDSSFPSDLQDSERWEFYSVLMVDRTATQAEINNAYRRLSRQFHPDKHASADAKKAAQNVFHRIKRAKDVLCDNHLRRIYDAVGIKGLEEFENGQMVRKDMRSSKEIIEEYERLLELKKFQEELSSYNPHATSTVNIDMCSVFESGYYDADDNVSLLDQLISIDISKMKLDQGFSFPVGDKDEITVGSSLLTSYRTSRTNGNLSCNWRRSFSSGIVSNASLLVGSNTQLSGSVSKQLTKYTQVSGNGQVVMTQNMLIIGYGFSLSTQLSQRLRAELTVQTGMNETLKCSLYYTGETVAVTYNIQTGMTFHDSSPSPNLASVRIIKSFPEHDLKIKMGGLCSLSKCRYYVGFIKQFPSKQSMLSTTLSLDSDEGVELHVTVRRGRQKFLFPILMSSEVQPVATVYGLVLPVLAYAAVKALFIVPYLRQQREAAVEKKREEEKERLAARRLAALEEIELMSNSVQQTTEQEERKSGLVIVKALYGKLQVIEISGHMESGEENVINVTIPLQHQVKDSALRVPSEVSKASMPGFYDPCYGEEKRLYIRYKFHNKLHHVTLNDADPIAIPKQAHLMSSSSSSAS